jgi:hypothetical protein
MTNDPKYWIYMTLIQKIIQKKDINFMPAC